MLLRNYQKYSPDIIAIEGVWRLVRERLCKTEPAGIETRAQFLGRLRRQVEWLNSNSRDQLMYFCTNQKERAHKIIEVTKGGKCRF